MSRKTDEQMLDTCPLLLEKVSWRFINEHGYRVKVVRPVELTKNVIARLINEIQIN